MSRTNIISTIIVIIAAGLLLAAFWRYDGLPERKKGSARTGEEKTLEPRSENEPVLPAALGEKASQQEKDAFAQEILKIAREGTTFTIKNNCVFSPNVLQVEQGAKITFHNTDFVKHTVYTYEELSLSPDEKKVLTANFKPGPGLYGINCDGPATVAYLWVD